MSMRFSAGLLGAVALVVVHQASAGACPASASGQERKFAQLPVSLPAPEQLTAAAGRSTVVGQLRAFRVLCDAISRLEVEVVHRHQINPR